MSTPAYSQARLGRVFRTAIRQQGAAQELDQGHGARGFVGKESEGARQNC